MSNIPKFLNPMSIPLHGEHLIEASAGTGKTFTIVLLYLRLLLGIGYHNTHSRPLSVREILVVTFTEAATVELKNRIRENIHDLRLSCIRGFSHNNMLTELLNNIKNYSKAASLLLLAEHHMDEAAIFTIHSFCQRMLKLHTFECGLIFDQKLIKDERPLLKQVAIDFWRRFFYPLPHEIAKLILKEWAGPEQLLETLYPLLYGEIPCLNSLSNRDETLISRHNKNVLCINKIKTQWLNINETVIYLTIHQSGVDKRIYNNKSLILWIAKISKWAKSETFNYDIPPEIAYFGQKFLNKKTKANYTPYHTLFLAIDNFLSQVITLRDLIIIKALKTIRNSIQQEKKIQNLLSFNDLISRLDEAIQQSSGIQLLQVIRKRFPVAFIDEFQDTDPQQYRIFRTIYINQSKHALLLLIGDPKQAIYAFRGADIFTYIQARNEVTSHYTLNTNWRSSPSMVNNINYLFSRINEPFIFENIHFHPVNSAFQKNKLKITLDNQLQSSLCFWLKNGDGFNVTDYYKHMAKQCALNISDWLKAGQQNRAFFCTIDNISKPVEASDITVLVRNSNEANIIRKEFDKIGIPSVYLSNTNSVYSTPEAQELLWLLHAILLPKKINIVRTAMATSLFYFDSVNIDSIEQNKNRKDKIVDTLTRWQLIWRERGILAMLHEFMKERNVAQNLLISKNNERPLIDFLHLGELLQIISEKLPTPYALLRYLQHEIIHSYSDNQLVEHQLRLDGNSRHMVQIVTIHKSKGLQYPLVWLPFAVSFRKNKLPVYHNRKNFNRVLDLIVTKEGSILANEERLAEDLRLLYVALTRSIYHCSVGVAPLFVGQRKKVGKSDLHHSALGYLLQCGKAATGQELFAILKSISQDNSNSIELKTFSIQQTEHGQLNLTNINPLVLETREVTNKHTDYWRITSYTELTKKLNKTSDILTESLNFDSKSLEKENYNREKKINLLTPHCFPRGASHGTFLHAIFESMDFEKSISQEKLSKLLEQYRYPSYWCSMLSKWILNIINTPLNQHGLTLSSISNGNKLAEMTFYLPINRMLTADILDDILRSYDPLSQQKSLPLTFHQVGGILKGYIDLVFRWQDQYYILDYKTNWLGRNNDFYENHLIEKTMIEQRYDVQYHLYTLALHRYLKNRLNNYSYEKNFGGVFYLFLRCFDDFNSKTSRGIFFTRPKEDCVLKLDKLFHGSKNLL